MSLVPLSLLPFKREYCYVHRDIERESARVLERERRSYGDIALVVTETAR